MLLKLCLDWMSVQWNQCRIHVTFCAYFINNYGPACVEIVYLVVVVKELGGPWLLLFARNVIHSHKLPPKNEPVFQHWGQLHCVFLCWFQCHKSIFICTYIMYSLAKSDGSVPTFSDSLTKLSLFLVWSISLELMLIIIVGIQSPGNVM